MQSVVRHLPRVVVALVAITVAGLAGAAYNFTNVNYPGAPANQVFGCNNKGLVTGVGYYDDGTAIGWVYDSKKQEFTKLPPLSPCVDQSAMGISESGVIAGGCTVSDSLDEGFILDKKNNYTYLNYPGFEHTTPRAISKTGVVTGYAIDNWDNYNWIAFIYDPKSGAFTQIAFPVPDPTLTAWQPIAQGITANGRVVGDVILANADWSYADYFAFVREPNGGMTYFQVNGQPTRARGINDAGVITGFTYTPDYSSTGGFVGTLPKLGGFQTMTNAEEFTVPFEGATATDPEAIDNSGGLVGVWVDGSGNLYGFTATPLPKGKK